MTAGTTRDPATVGPYRLVRKLGEGGMGVVHLAADPAGREVALKVLRAHIANDDEARRRLAREVATLRRVRHPRVAEVLDADVTGATPYLVTRFVPGRSLEDEVRTTGPLPAGQVARLGRSLAGALAAIHAAGVVHRDVKPANVMLVGGDPVLIDFGIAHVADESRITRTGLVMGTPGYLSPELIYGGAVTEATDWWAWGATLAFAATGRQPFGNGPIERILEQVRLGRSDLDGVEPALRDLLALTLTVDAARRPAAAALLSRLDDVIAGVTTAPAAVDPRPGAGPYRSVDRYGRPTARPDDRTARSAPPGQRASASPPVDRTKRMPPPAAPPAAAPPRAAPPTHPPRSPARNAAGIPPYPGASRPPAAHQNPPPFPGVPAYGTPAPPPAAYPPYPQHQPGPQHQVGYPGHGGWVGQGYPPPARPDRPGAASWVTDPSIRVTGTLTALAVALAAVAAVAPGGALVLAFVLSVLARLVHRSSTGLQRRRAELGGPRATDAVVTAAALPWRLLAAGATSVVALLLPVLVATSIAFIIGAAVAQGGAPQPSGPGALFASMLAGSATAWWGPGGLSLRTGSRTVVRAVTRGRAGRIALSALAALVVVAATMVSSEADYTPDWRPFPSPFSIVIG